MELLAIKSEKGRGVYICNNKKEKSDILKQYSGCSNRIFAENEKEKALSWAGVKEISNRPQQVVDISMNKGKQKESQENDFCATLEALRKKRYSYVKITLISGKTFMLWLDFIDYISFKIIPNYVKIMNYYSYISCDSTIESFSDWKKDIDKYYNDSVDYENALYECFKTLSNHSHYKGIYGKIEKPVIQVIGDIAIISNVFNSLSYCQNSIYMEIYKYMEKDVAQDFVFNTKTILTIEPYKLAWEITDKGFMRVINKLEKEGINCRIQ